MGLFALLRSVNGSFELEPVNAGDISPGLLTAILTLSLVGFGIKAGVMPLHVWLPSSHAIAPSHVSAIMSGVIIKMGIYGLVRITSLLPPPPSEWGAIILALGAVSGILGVVYAIGQHDLKRLLAYHSIENIGIIVMGLGLALLGRTMGRPDWIILGMSGALLHVWNHAFFKGLLFLSAGSVVHATHTREIDHLGGLSRKMSCTSLCFLVGAVAICGLPPLNGFVSEFFIFVGLFRTLDSTTQPAFADASLAAPALALIGALAAACFVKVFGAVFLGTARTEHAMRACESPKTMLSAMLVLVGCCSVIGLAPTVVAPVLTQAVEAWAPELAGSGTELVALAPLGWIGTMAWLLLGAILLCAGALWSRIGHSDVGAAGPTWGCGYAAPTARMQYTSSSFAQMLVDLFAWALRPDIQRPARLSLFPSPSGFRSTVPDVVLDRGILPAMRGGAWLFNCFRILQQGNVQVYLLYVFLVLFGLLLWP
jgi:hydrogenase-4 component B